MSTDIPPSVQQVMDDYTACVHQAVPDLLIGVYLQGSLALGAYQPGLSDIDFISVTSRRCATADIDRLRVVHQKLLQRHPQAQLSGSYLQWHDVGRPEATIQPHPHVHDGVFHASGYHDINAITWWIVKHRGIALLGPSPEHFAITVDWDDLLAKMYDNLHTYWASFTTNPKRIGWLLDDYGIQWTVLGVLRQFYTFRERAITSKVGAGAYALAHTPKQWHRLIREAIAIREGARPSLYRFRIVRAASAYAFLQLMIAACQADTSGAPARPRS